MMANPVYSGIVDGIERWLRQQTTDYVSCLAELLSSKHMEFCGRLAQSVYNDMDAKRWLVDRIESREWCEAVMEATNRVRPYD